MYNKYDLDNEQIKVSKKWFLEVGWELFNENPADPKAAYFESKVKKLHAHEQYSKKIKEN